MILMRAAHRVIAATAVGLPLLLAGSGVVLAKNPHKPHRPHRPHRIEQEISGTSTESSNTVTQIIKSRGGSFQQIHVSSQSTTDDDDD
jgi:hypothetical protein